MIEHENGPLHQDRNKLPEGSYVGSYRYYADGLKHDVDLYCWSPKPGHCYVRLRNSSAPDDVLVEALADVLRGNTNQMRAASAMLYVKGVLSWGRRA